MDIFNEFKSKLRINPKNTNEIKNPSKGYAISSMVLGICSIVFICLFYISVPCGIVGLVLGCKSIMEMRDGWAMAKAGFITSIIGLGLTALYLFILIVITVITGIGIGSINNIFKFLR